MFNKRLSELTADDIQSVITSRVQEDTTVELKGRLSQTRDGAQDPWYGDARRIGNEAKRDLTKELVAFANAQGGTLILGITEDGDKRADSITPVPACRQLADRLAASIAASTDPKLTSLEYAGVETDPNGSGVVVFRVPQSPRAPHRDSDTRECHVRVGDRSEPMGMRQVQDLTLQRHRGLEQTMDQLRARHHQFSILTIDDQEMLPNMIRPTVLRACAVRATAVPLEDLFVDRISRNADFHLPSPRMVMLRNGHSQEVSRREHLNWTPILRGIRSVQGDAERSFRSARTITSTGLIENAYHGREMLMRNVIPSPKGFPMWWILRTFALLIVTVEAFRTRYGRPDLPFALDFEWRLPEGSNALTPEHLDWFDREVTPVEELNRVETYEMPDRSRISQLFETLHSDVGSSCGMELPYAFPIDFDLALEDIMRR